MDSSQAPPRQGVGARVLRKEDARHLAGKGIFVADMAMHGLEEVAFLRSPVAHARLVAIRKPHGLERQVVLRGDMPEARDIEGNSGLPSYKHSAQPPLAQDKIRFVGEPIALAFAPTRAQAEDIAERVDIEFAELPAIPDVRTSREIAAHTRVHEHWEDNTFLTLHADKRFAELSAKASVVVRRHIDLSRQCMVPLEGKAVLAYWDERLDQLIVYSATQIPHLIRNGLSQVLGLDSAMVRVIAPDVGGGFGYKGMLHQEEVCIAWLAWKYRKPFRFVEDRREHLIVGANSRQHHYEMVGYADERGRLLALDARLAIDGGAYSVSPFTIGLEPGQALGNLPGPYAFEGYRCTVECLATNKPGFMPYRGVARTGVCFAMELLIDAIAREVGREPWEVRKENLVPAAAMPYVNVMNKHFDSGDYPASLQEVRGMIDFDGVRSRQRRERAGGQAASRRVGVGFATYTEQSAHGASVFATWGTPFVPGFDSATVRIMPDGSVEIRVGVQSHGQGMETTFAQIVHEILGVELARIKMVHGDTGLTPFSTGTYASRSLVMSGGAVSRACKTLVPRLKYIAAHLLQRSAESLTLAQARIGDGEVGVSLREIADAWYLFPYRLPPGVDPAGLEVTMGYKPAADTGCFTYASHAAVVEVDLETGEIKILDYAIVEDCGTLINPMVVEGQTYGGVAQGIGTALYEEMGYDPQGQPLASTLADYLIPGATEVPALRVRHIETPSPHTEFGAKGMGEGGAIAPPAVIFNAVNDALSDLGVEVLHTPLTPRRLLEAIARARGQPAREGAAR